MNNPGIISARRGQEKLDLAGNTGASVYGINLLGDYNGGDYTGQAYTGTSQYLTLGPVDCSLFRDVNLSFHRWLNCDVQPYVRNTVEVSNDGQRWTVVWQNNSQNEVADNMWQEQVFDISDVSDERETVYVRWGHRIATDISGGTAFPYSGWNIDDVELRGEPLF